MRTAMTVSISPPSLTTSAGQALTCTVRSDRPVTLPSPPISSRATLSAGETPVRLHLVAVWREATVFTEAERAALALAEEGTRLADAHQGVSDETWGQVRKHYDDEQTAALVSLVALINAADRLAVILHQKGGPYEAGMFAAALD